MRSWRGSVSLSLCVAVACASGAGPVVTDLGSALFPGVGKRPNAIGINSVTPHGTLLSGQSYYQNGTAVASKTVVYRSGGFTVDSRPGEAWSVNQQGDFLSNGELVFGKYTHHSGGTLNRADGTTLKLPRPPGYDWLNARSINDSGVIVGHLSAFVPSPFDFDYGIPYYRRGTQIWTPSEKGTMLKVNNKGWALMFRQGANSDAGIWSPEGGFVPIPGFFPVNTYEPSRAEDFNDNNEVLQDGADLNGDQYSQILSPTIARKIYHPKYPTFFRRGGVSGGMNNLGNLTSYLRFKDPDGVFRFHWSIYENDAWVDVTDVVRNAMPAGSSLLTLGDIDDYKRAYGIVQLADGSQTIVQVNMVPEPATLGALGLGLAVIARKRRRDSSR